MSPRKNALKFIDMTSEMKESGVGYLKLSGELDIGGAEEIGRDFSSLITSKKTSIILELSNVTLLTSEGLAMLMAGINSLRENGRIMVVLNPNPKVERVLKLANLKDLLPIEHDMEAALNRVRAANALMSK